MARVHDGVLLSWEREVCVSSVLVVKVGWFELCIYDRRKG